MAISLCKNEWNWRTILCFLLRPSTYVQVLLLLVTVGVFDDVQPYGSKYLLRRYFTPQIVPSSYLDP